MIATIALRLAGPGAVLASRPGGVVHVIPPGPLTRSGRFIPRARRTVCRAHTRQLAVMDPREQAPGPVCARCVACLTSTAAAVRQAPTSRDQYKARFAGVSLDDLAAAVLAAKTPAELDQAAHLTLLLHGHKATREHLVNGQPLSKVIGHRREVFTHDPTRPDRFDEQSQLARDRRRNEWAQLREDRLARLLHGTAKPRIRTN